MAKSIHLPIIDLSSPDRLSTSNSLRQACINYGFFYVINHGVEEELLQRVIYHSKRFFSIPLEDKMKLAHKEHRGYTPLYAEKLDPSSSSKGDSKEMFCVGPLEGAESHLNQWPSEDILPHWRQVMEDYHDGVLNAGRRVIRLIALALNLDDDFFEKIGALDRPAPFLRLLHYPGVSGFYDEKLYGASAHSDYGTLTLLTTDGVPGLQARFAGKNPSSHKCGKMLIMLKEPLLLTLVTCSRGGLIVAFFLDPNKDCIIECLESCCSESFPPRFPPIRSGVYLNERFRAAFS